MQPMTVTEIASAVKGVWWNPSEQVPVVSAVSTDSRRIVPGSLFLPWVGEKFDGHLFIDAALDAGAAGCLCAKLPQNIREDKFYIKVADTRLALRDLASAYRDRFEIPFVQITGSVGKTTTKDFIAAVLSARYKTLKSQGNHNNEFGLPVTVFELDPSYQAGVFEMGMDARGDISRLTAVVKPDIGVITNVGVSHLERLGTRENILAAKLEITEGMADGSPLILCGDNDLLSTVEIPRLRVLRYGIEAPELDARAEEIVTGEGETRFVIVWKGGRYPARIPAMGRHNAMNALAGFLVGIEAGMTPEEAAEALSGYAISGMRQRVRLWNGIKVVEDCYNAAPDSMNAALDTLSGMECEGRKICVFADMRELGSASDESHRAIGQHAARVADKLLVYGPQSHLYVEGANAAGLSDAREYPDRPALTQAVREAVRPGDIVWFKGSLLMNLEEVLRAVFPDAE